VALGLEIVDRLTVVPDRQAAARVPALVKILSSLRKSFDRRAAVG
jgi:hypothetical protein